MQPHVSIQLQCCRSDQLRQLASWTAPQQIHLEKALLAVQQTRRSGELLSTLGLNGWNPVHATRYKQWLLKPSQGQLPLQSRETGSYIHQPVQRDTLSKQQQSTQQN